MVKMLENHTNTNNVHLTYPVLLRTLPCKMTIITSQHQIGPNGPRLRKQIRLLEGNCLCCEQKSRDTTLGKYRPSSVRKCPPPALTHRHCKHRRHRQSFSSSHFHATNIPVIQSHSVKRTSINHTHIDRRQYFHFIRAKKLWILHRD